MRHNSNPFRDTTQRKVYALAMGSYEQRSKLLFSGPGQRTTLNGYAGPFWRGYDGVEMNWDAASKRTAAYACYVAGRDVRAQEALL